MMDMTTPPETVLTNARLVLAGEMVQGSVRFAGGEIADVAQGAARGEDMEGDLLIPGLIELHTDNLERHIQPRPKVDWPHDAAILAHDGELASVGITTVFDAMRVGSIPEAETGYAEYARGLASELMALRSAGALRISHFLHLRAEVCSATLAEELEAFGPGDRVGIVSLMDHTPGQRQFRDITKMKAYVQGKRALDDAGFQAHIDRLRRLREAHGAKHEAATVAAAKRFGAVLASHDDTTEEHVATSAGYGIRLAEFPTTEEAARACHAHGIRVMMGAPNLIRGGSHSGNVAAEALAREGLLDIISSDYVPSALLTSAFRLARLWDDLPRAVATVTATPAAAAGLKDRGRIEAGLKADLVRVRMLGDTPVIRAVWSHGRRVA